jgi:hypothetical protein
MPSFVARLGIGVGVVLGVVSTMADDIRSLREMFVDPPREYASGPLWTWNDMLTEEQIVSTLEDLASQGVMQAFVHPRPGLMTPYLSDDWFRLWKKALETAERLDMNIWIYDENSYPSGFAGGYVPEAMPESRGQGLVYAEEAAAPAWADDILAVYQMADDGFTKVTDAVRDGGTLSEGRYTVVRIALANASPWYGDWWYVDLLTPGVTEKFLEITMDAYKREVGEQFGQRIPGVFTDEPHLRPVGQLHWTPDLPEVFEQRWGYHLLDHLPSLLQPVGDYKRVRHNYYQTLLDLFIERWAKPFYEYCEENNLEFTGHYWEHGWPDCGIAPDNMAMYAWQQRPGIDTLFNQYREDVHAQFGNVRAVLELASVANQLGKKRTLCEAYGGAGWDMRFEDMKRIGDWLYVLGVNTLDEHLSRISMRGARKADYPPSFSYHAPWWDAYHVPAKYFTRLSAALSHGEQINEILVIEPTTTAWMYQGAPAEPRNALGAAFQQLVTRLAQDQVEFDIGCEDIIADYGKAEENLFVVGERAYHTVIISPLTENLNAATVDLLETYVAAGGIVLNCAEAAPAYVDGQPSERVAALARAASWSAAASEALSASLLEEQAKRGCVVRRADGDEGILYHHRRQLPNGQVLFLVNTSIDNPTAGTVLNLDGSVESWDLASGAMRPYAYARGEDGSIPFELAPAASLLLVFHDGTQAAPPAATQPEREIAPAGEMTVRRASPNVLIIDYLDLEVTGQTFERIYYHRAAELAFQQHGLEHNPWYHRVQFRDSLISKTFPEDSGLTATYRFTIEGAVPADLTAVVERPDLYTVTCNVQPVTATPGEWWFDKQFGVLDLSKRARVGENTLTLTAAPFTMFHELAAVFIRGDFALEPAEHGFSIVAARDLGTRPWHEQGMPIYGESVIYTQQFEIASPAAKHRVVLPEWYGSVAEVLVNGESAGHVWHQPWQCEFSGLVRPGTNTIDVRVIGTPKNTFGPHHGNAALGLAGPEHFRRAPETGPPAGSEYSTIGYGLFSPFKLISAAPQP